MTYFDRNVAMSAVDRSCSETAETSHSPMDGTMSKQSAVDVIRSIARNGTNHVCRI